MGHFCDDSVAVKWRLVEDQRAIFPHLTACDNEWKKEWMKCPVLEDNRRALFTLSSDVSIKWRHWKLLSVHWLPHPAQNYLISTETTKKKRL